jgi:hypothetical protein
LIFAAGLTDARPTAPMYEVFRLFAPPIQEQLVALQQALSRDLAAVNATLKGAGGAAVVARAAEVRLPSPGTGR